MRIRTLAAAAVAAAGLSVTLAGAAGAATPQDPPPADVHVVACEGGSVRPITLEERERLEEMQKRAAEKGMTEKGLIKKGPVDGRVAEKGAVEKGTAPVVVFTTPPGEKGERVSPVPDDGIPAEKLTAVCAVPARPVAPEAS